MRKDFISVVIPAYNEHLRIVPTVQGIIAYLKDRREEFEIIVVDDGSTDGTAGLLKGAGIDNLRLIRNPVNMGKGAAVRNGVLSSRGSLILTCDADMSAPIEEMEKLLSFINNGYDIAIGSRGLKDSEIEVRQPWYREGMGKVFNLFVRLLLMGGIKDTQCGFKLFKAGVAKGLFGKSRIAGFSFDAEVLFLAKKAGMRIKEVPIRWLNFPTSKVRLFGDPPRMMLDLLKIRMFYLAGLYK